MFSDIRKRAKKAGQPPGTAIYTGDKTQQASHLTVIHYTAKDLTEKSGTRLSECFTTQPQTGVTWTHVSGLSDTDTIKTLAEQYHLHPLTVEDILNVEQRPKIEEFEGYYFITLKALSWDSKLNTFSAEQLSIVFGKDFILSFQEHGANIFAPIIERLRMSGTQRIRQQGSDYLAYRLIDSIIDQYFVVLEGLSDQIEKIENLIIASPIPKNARTLYRLKRQILMLRKAIWPTREALSHLLQDESKLISSFTHVYLRDVYDHAVQAIDTIETFRDMLGGILDIYLSSLTTRMNEIMKVLTIIATIFIPITFIASLYGMNFQHMPELHWHLGYPLVLGVMLAVVIFMLLYFKRKKWI